MSGRDRETRDRLVEEATWLFAERGFAKVTVRDICLRARANVAAVNYHFGGKSGLYEEIVRTAIGTMKTTTEAIYKAGNQRPAEEQLAAFIEILLHRVVEAKDGWIHRLMLRELSDPTPALDLVIEQVIRPRLAYLRRVVIALLGRGAADTATVEHCVVTVQSQCLAPLRDRLAMRPQPRVMTKRQLDAMAARIQRFSLAGIRALARRPQAHRS
jgi:AcrR family transcriptional regulator